MNHTKYRNNQSFDAQRACDWLKKSTPDHAPMWSSVDLRDGNQALITPLTLTEKLEYFDLLTHIGFKHIEVGYPAQNEDEFNFIRKLIQDKLIPEDVTIQVICDMNRERIKRTLSSLKGCRQAILHVFGPL